MRHTVSAERGDVLFMPWLLLLSMVFLGVGVIVFVLTRDSFRASSTRRKPLPVASPTQTSSDAAAINTLMREKLAAPLPSCPTTLLSGQNDKETDTLADTLAELQENPILPTAPKAYLRLEERDESLDHLLVRRITGGSPAQQPREFSIAVTEKNEAPPEHGKEL